MIMNLFICIQWRDSSNANTVYTANKLQYRYYIDIVPKIVYWTDINKDIMQNLGTITV